MPKSKSAYGSITPHLVVKGDALIAFTVGDRSDAVEISDAAAVDELKDLIKARVELGKEISAKLAEHGLIAAASIDNTVVDINTGGGGS